MVIVATVVVSIAGLSVGILGSLASGEVARSAFFGVRARAEPVLGFVYTFFAVAPWLTAFLMWRSKSERGEPVLRRVRASALVLAGLGFVNMLANFRVF